MTDEEILEQLYMEETQNALNATADAIKGLLHCGLSKEAMFLLGGMDALCGLPVAPTSELELMPTVECRFYLRGYAAAQECCDMLLPKKDKTDE